MTTAQDQQSREAYEDGKWYWVEREGWHGEPPTIAPACYKANCDAWYSHIFSGISTPYLKVLEPCERQAARALPAGIEPVGYLIDWPDEPDLGHYFAEGASTTGRSQPLHTAAQVLAMGRVPLTPDQVADLCEAWLQNPVATDSVNAYEAGFRDAEAAHGIIHPTGD